jgi:hypothetical protein
MTAPLCRIPLILTLKPKPHNANPLLRLEWILPRCCIDKARRILGQEQARLQQLAHDLAHPLHIGRMAAVALFPGGTWVTLGPTLGFCPGEGSTHALAVAALPFESWDVVASPASVRRQSYSNRR